MQREDEATSETGRGRLIRRPRTGAAPHAIALAKRLGLRYVTTDALSIRRRRSGKGWAYIGSNGRPIQEPRIIRRLARLAVPPAYRNVLYAADPTAHLQAVGRDAARRLQYRYHPQWQDVREGRPPARSAGEYIAADSKAYRPPSCVQASDPGICLSGSH
jgi:DNA topoisomerase-1